MVRARVRVRVRVRVSWGHWACLHGVAGLLFLSDPTAYSLQGYGSLSRGQGR